MTKKTLAEASKPFFIKKGQVGVLLIHGFTGTPYIFREIGQLAANAGYTVSAPLLAGHGTHPNDLEKTSKEDWYQSILIAYDDLAKQCKTVYVVGVSFGGNLCLKLAAERNPKGLILIGVPRWIYRYIWARIFTPIFILLGIRYFNKGLSDVVDEDSLLGGPNLSYLKIPLLSVRELFKVMTTWTDLYLPKISVPTLIVQSDNDGLVVPKSGKYLFEHLTTESKELIWISRPHHELHIGDGQEQIYNYIIEFINRQDHKQLKKAGS